MTRQGSQVQILYRPPLNFKESHAGFFFYTLQPSLLHEQKDKSKPPSSRIKQTGSDAEQTYATGTHYKRNSIGQKHPKYKLSERLSAFPFSRSTKRYLNAPCDPLKPRTRNVGIPSCTQTPNATEAQQSTWSIMLCASVLAHRDRIQKASARKRTLQHKNLTKCKKREGRSPLLNLLVSKAGFEPARPNPGTSTSS